MIEMIATGNHHRQGFGQHRMSLKVKKAFGNNIMKSPPFLLIVASQLFFLIATGYGNDDRGNSTTALHNANGDETSKKVRSLLTPRMDYEQWKPVGRGDPLKNDPTYDYVPPVLDRVHYWIEPTLRKPDPPLQAENRKTEILLLGGIALKKNRSSVGGDHKPYDTFMKFVDAPKFSQPKIVRPQLPIPLYFPSKYFSNKRTPEESTVKVPSMVLVPPPIASKDPGDYQYIPLTSTTFTTPSSTQSVTVQEANLVYQTSTLMSGNKFREKFKTQLPPNPNDHTTFKTTTAQSLTVPDNQLSDDKKIKFPIPESYIEIEFPTLTKNESAMTTTKKKQFLNFTPPKYTDFDNAVTGSYASLKPQQNSVRIPEELLLSQLLPSIKPQSVLQTMQTMHPPPIPTTLQNLQNELSNTDPFVSSESKLSSIVSTTPAPETMTTTSLTTDPLFKHYKQPTGPLKGPMYLIIQGHSKVKNFSPSKEIHGIPVQEVNEVLTPEDDKYSVKHLHSPEVISVEKENNRKGRSGDIQTLSHVVQTGWGAIDFPEVDDYNRRNDYDVREIELGVKYDVSVPSNKTH